MKNIRKNYIVLVSLLICGILIISTLFFVYPATAAKAKEQPLDKLIIPTTIEDDFEDDGLLITLQPNISRFRGIDDSVKSILKSVGAISIEDLSQFDEQYVDSDGSLNESVDASLTEHYKQNPFMQMLYIKLDVNDKQNVLNVKNILEGSDLIYSVSPNTYTCEPQNIPYLPIEQINDPRYCEQWALSEGYDNGGMGVPDAWAITKGSKNIRVGIIDTGIAVHNDLEASVDRTLGGDFYHMRSSEIPETRTMPIHQTKRTRHGTCVAGIIAAKENNNIGNCP